MLNLDDDETRLLAAALPAERLRTYSLQDESARPVRQRTSSRSRSRSPFTGERHVPVRLQVPGRHNVANALAALAAAEAAGVPLAEAAEALAGFTGLRRRFELVGDGERRSP